MSSSSSSQGSADRAEPTSRATSLLDLPDELLVDIFRAVHDSGSYCGLPGDKMFFIRICKRIYDAVLPTWTTRVALDVPKTAADVVQLADNVRTSAYVRQRVKDVSFRCAQNGVSPETADALLLFPNLESLTFDTTHYGEGKIPPRVSNTMSTIQSLHRLELDPHAFLEDQAFDLRTTSVRVLVLATIDYTMLSHGRGDNLDTLIIDSYTLEGCAVPWHTLRTLCLRGVDGETTIEAATILPSLETAVGSGPVPLNTLELAIDGLLLNDFDEDAHRSEQYEVMYSVLQLARPQVLKVARVESSPLAPPTGVGPFPSVVKLDLEASINLSPDADLVAFLRLFPSMTDFHLACRWHIDSPPLVADYIDMSPATFSMRYPGFARLIVILKATLVLRFRFGLAYEPLFLRCTRAMAGDDFMIEAWRKH